MYFDLHTEARQPVLKLLFMLGEGTKVASVKGRSPLWQVRRPAAPKLSHSIRLCEEGLEDTLERVAPRAGWWSLPRTTLCDFAKELGIVVDSGIPLFDVLWALVEGCLGTSAAETLAIYHRKLARGNTSEEITSALLQVDEAIQVMDKHDFDRVTEAKKKATAAVASHADFKASFSANASSVCAAKGAGKQKKAVVKKVVLPHHSTQGDAKRFIPPTTSIWRDCARGGWRAHCPPNSRLSESFDKNGGCSDLAFRFILRKFWCHFAEKMRASPAEVCPVDGLFNAP